MTGMIQFTKIRGAGNDCIYISTLRLPIRSLGKTAIEWSVYHTGINSDGLALIGRSDKTDFSMRIFSTDGSEAMMCGNTSRCIGEYLYEYGLALKNIIILEILSGIKVLKPHLKAQTVKTVAADMGVPLEARIIDFDNKFPFVPTQVSMGNPYLVTFVDDIRNIDFPEIGLRLERHPLLPDRTSVESAQITGENKVHMRVWRRGPGTTQACGTGACATTVAAHLTGRMRQAIDIMMNGSTLTIEWDKVIDHICMTEPAAKVSNGTIELREQLTDFRYQSI